MVSRCQAAFTATVCSIDGADAAGVTVIRSRSLLLCWYNMKRPLPKPADAKSDLNAHEKLFAERVAQKVLALVNDEWIAAGG
jgi:hypothetical protein